MFKAKEESWGSFLLELLILVLIALFIRFYIFQFFRVSGPSMCPTLNEMSDECLAGKGEFIFVNEILYQLREPARGEIVIFRPPNNKVYYVKRVIGVPGDIVEIRDGVVYVNDQKIDESYLSSKNKDNTATSQDRFEVPQGEFLLFGDNRSQSLDARQCFNKGGCKSELFPPFVGAKNIIGRAEFVVWPISTWRGLENDPYGLFEKVK